MPETKTQTQILSGNLERNITLRKMLEWLRHKSSKTTLVYSMSAINDYKTSKIHLMTLIYERTKVTYIPPGMEI